MPYWATFSYPDFQTRVTSQAFVACNRQDKNADTALPPTVSCQQPIRLCQCDDRDGKSKQNVPLLLLLLLVFEN
jgi:hypothetical protein